MVGRGPPQSRKNAEPARARLPRGLGRPPRCRRRRGLPRVAALGCSRRAGGRGEERSGELPPRPGRPHFYPPAGDRLFFFAGCASPSQLSLELAAPPAIAPLAASLARSCFFSSSFPSQRRQCSAPPPRRPPPGARPRSRSRSRSRRESGILPGCHLPGEEEADERAGAIYRHPKAQGKGELLWHLIPASALLFPLAESLALLWQCGKYIYIFFSFPLSFPHPSR